MVYKPPYLTEMAVMNEHFFIFHLSITIKGLNKKQLELGHRTKIEVTMWTQHHIALRWDWAGCPVPASGAFLTCSSLHNQVFLALSLCLAIPTLPCSTTAWNSSTMTHMPSHAQTFIYKEIQTRVAIKTLYITQLGLQPSVALYSYSNNAYLCLTSD